MAPVFYAVFFPNFESFALFPQNSAVKKIFSHGLTQYVLPNFYAPAYSKNSGWALSITPVCPVRLSVHPSVCLSGRTSHFVYGP